MKKVLMYLLVVGFCQTLGAQFFNRNQGWNNGSFNRGGWNNGNFNRGGWNNSMQNLNRGSWGNNFRGQFYPTSSGVGRAPVRYYEGNNNQQGQQQQQNNSPSTPTGNNGRNLTMNNGYLQGRVQAQTAGYYRVDTKRNIWLFVPRLGVQNSVR